MMAARFETADWSSDDSDAYRSFHRNLSSLREYENRFNLIRDDYLHCVEKHRYLLSQFIALLKKGGCPVSEQFQFLDRLILLQRHLTQFSSK